MLWILGTLVALCALVYAVGAMMPEEHTATVTAEYHATPEAVWDVITQPRRFPEWRRGLKSVTVDGDRVTEVHERFGELSYRMTVFDRPRGFQTAGAGGREQGFSGDWTFRLTPIDGGAGTRLEITEHGRVFSPLFRVMSKYVFGHETTLRNYHADLARRLHSSGT